MKVYLIEWSGCECGGLERVAFDSREKAEKWEYDNTETFGQSIYRWPKGNADSYEIVEVELE